MVLSMMVSLWLVQAPGCAKDTDCKGERICEAGLCVAPPQVTPPRAEVEPPRPTPPSEEASYPRVVRRNGLVCVQTMEAGDRVAESCRQPEPPPRVRPLPTRAPRSADEDAPSAETTAPEPGSRFVSDFLLHGGVMALAGGGFSAALPQAGGTLSFGARFRSGVGVAGLGSISIGFNPVGAIFVISIAPALRFGNQSHFTLAAGPSLVAFNFAGGRGSGVAGSLLAAGVFALGRSFSLNIHTGLHADASGVLFTLGAGFGLGAL